MACVVTVATAAYVNMVFFRSRLKAMENVENLILEHLRSIRSDVAGMRDDIREIKQRLSNLESGIGSLKRDTADLYTENAAQHLRYDRLADRIEKIEKRLELTN